MTLPSAATSEPRVQPARRRPRDELVALIPAGLLLILWMVWIAASGGYGSDVWYPSALGALALAVVMLIVYRRRLPSTRSARVAMIAFAALVALNYLSILWAGSPGDALAASNKLALYAIVAWVFAVLPWRPRTFTALLGIWALGVCALCADGLLRATSAASLNPFFVDQRYATPLQYSNATAALAVMGMWPALILSARRELPFWLRGVFLAGAVFLAEFALLPQSRAALLGLILTAPIALVAASDRLRLLLRMALVCGGLAITVPRTVAVDDAISAGHHVAPVLSSAATAMLFTSLAALLVGVLLALVENRLRLSWRPGWWRRPARTSAGRSPADAKRRRKRTRLAVAGVAVIALGVAAVVAAPTIVHGANTVLKKGREDASTGSTRLLSTTPEERFDYDRVALDLFAKKPILGVGAGNFGRSYDPLRRFPKHSQYTHNLPVRALSETGILGFGLLVVVIGALAVGLVQTIRRGVGLERAGAVAALTVAAYFLVHDSLDWLDQFPALAAPAFAFALAALAQRRAAAEPAGALPGRQGPVAGRARERFSGLVPAGLRRWVVVAVAVAACAGLFVALSGSYLSSRYVARAFATYRTRPQGAFNDLRRAESLNPLSADPIVSEGTIALYLGEPARAQAAFERAIRKEDDWYPRLELALLDAQAGRFAAASHELGAAAALDADDPLIQQAREMIARHQRINPQHFNQLLSQESTAGSEQLIR